MASRGRTWYIPAAFWAKPEIRGKWTDDMRLLALYLCTCPHRNIAACYFLPNGYIREDLGWTERRVTSTLTSLVNEGFIEVDSEAQVVLVVGAISELVTLNEKQVIGAVRSMGDLPPTHLTSRLAEITKNDCKDLSEAIVKGIDSRAIPYREATDSLSIPYRMGIQRDGIPMPPDTDSDTDTESDIPSSLTGVGVSPVPAQRRTRKGPPEYTEDFSAFWGEYPRKIEKAAAFEAWSKRLTEQTFETGERITAAMLVQAATNYADDCRANGTAETYIKHAATFLGPKHPFEDFLQAHPNGRAKASTEPEGYRPAVVWS